MKKLILAFLLSSPAFAGEDYLPGMEYTGVLESVSAVSVKIDGKRFQVPGGTLLKRGSGKTQVRHQLKAGEKVIFAIQADKNGKASQVLSLIEPVNSALDEAE